MDTNVLHVDTTDFLDRMSSFQVVNEDQVRNRELPEAPPSPTVTNLQLLVLYANCMTHRQRLVNAIASYDGFVSEWGAERTNRRTRPITTRIQRRHPFQSIANVNTRLTVIDYNLSLLRYRNYWIDLFHAMNFAFEPYLSAKLPTEVVQMIMKMTTCEDFPVEDYAPSLEVVVLPQNNDSDSDSDDGLIPPPDI